MSKEFQVPCIKKHRGTEGILGQNALKSQSVLCTLCDLFVVALNVLFIQVFRLAAWRTAYLEVSAVLRCVLEGPQSSDQSGQLLGHLSRVLLLLLTPLLLHQHPVGLGLVVAAGRLPHFELLQSQVLREELRVAQALQDGVHEAGVAVVLESGDTWHLVPEGEPPAVAVIRRE